MIKVKHKNGEFLIKGSIDLGYIGLYENKDFLGKDSDNRQISMSGYTKKYEDGETANEVAKEIEEYFNNQEKKAIEHQAHLNNLLVFYLFYDLYEVQYPFWEHEDLVIKAFMPEGEDEDELGELIYTGKDKVFEIFGNYSCAEALAEDGSPMEHPNMVELFKKALPMFDLDEFTSTIVPTYLSLDLGTKVMSFQCDDGYDDDIFCGAYAEITDNLGFEDWHNH